MKKRRLQIDLGADDSLVLEALKENTDSTITEVIRNSITLYDWAVRENKQKRFVVALEQLPKNQSVIQPFLKGINSFRD